MTANTHPHAEGARIGAGEAVSAGRGGRVRAWVLVGGTALLCLGWLIHGWEVAGSGLQTRSGLLKGADYVQFYVMGSLVRGGRGAFLYDTSVLAEEASQRIHRKLQFHPARNPYGPQVALAFTPLSALPYLTSLALYSVISVCVYGAAVWLLWRSAPRLQNEGRYVALLAIGFPAFLVTLRFGQISTLTLLAPALAVSALGGGRRFVGGLSLGILAYKPQLLIVAAPVLILARDWRACAGIAAGGGLQLLVAWAAAGTGGLLSYVETVAALAAHPDLVVIYPETSHSLRGFIRLLGVSPGWATAAGVCVTIATVPIVAGIWRSGTSPLTRVSLLIAVTLLVTPHLLTYDLLLLAIPLIGLANWAVGCPEYGRVRAIVVLAVALYLAPFSSTIAVHTHVQVSTIVIAAAALASWRLATMEHPAGSADDCPASTDRRADVQ